MSKLLDGHTPKDMRTIRKNNKQQLKKLLDNASSTLKMTEGIFQCTLQCMQANRTKYFNESLKLTEFLVEGENSEDSPFCLQIDKIYNDNASMARLAEACLNNCSDY